MRKPTTCITLFLTVLSFIAVGQTVELQSTISVAHGELSDGNYTLSGNLGAPIANSSTEDRLSSGFISSSTGFFQVNIAPTFSTSSLTFDFSFSDASVLTGASISVEVSDDFDELVNTTLFYRAIGAQDFASVAMTDPDSDGVTFSFEISDATTLDQMGVEYYFTAIDLEDLDRREPEEGSYYEYLTDDDVIFPDDKLPSGTAASDYLIISTPYEIGGNNIGDLFDELIPESNYDQSDWRMYAYNPDASSDEDQYTEYRSGLSIMSRGQGYWMLISSDYPLGAVSFGAGTSPSYNQNDLFEMSLTSGWNMIGNPYTVDISWNDVISYNPSIDIGSIKTFANGTYSDGDILEPFEGGIVYLEGGNETIEIPFEGQSLPSSSTRIAEEEDAYNWQLDIVLNQGDLQSNLGGIGMHTEALITKDRKDNLNPPRFLSYLEMNFDHPEHALGAFSRDIVNVQNHYRWDFTVNGSIEGEPIILSWDSEKLAKQQTEIYLYNKQKQDFVDMMAVETVTVNNNAELAIYYGSGVMELYGPEVPKLGTLYPNPSPSGQDQVFFPLTLGATGASVIDFTVFGSDGTLIERWQINELEAGMHQIPWQHNLGVGLYIYQMSVQSDTGKQWHFKGKMIKSN